MHVLVTGAAGMLGQKLARRLAADGSLGNRQITRLSLVDRVEAVTPPGAGFEVTAATADLSQPSAASELVSELPDVIVHLAAVVSGEAEADLAKGYSVNLDGTRMLLDAVVERTGGRRPVRLVFASSIAVFGAPFPDVIGDDERLAPLTSYGTQKAMCELLLADYSRRGLLDGIALRLPTICVRPGSPNLAASGFFSNIVREPLNGREAVLPVADDVRHWFASPRAAVGFMVHAATLDRERIAGSRCLTMPGVTATVGDQLESLRRVAGDAALRLVRREPDETIARIVAGWPKAFDTRRATELGFQAESSFDEIVRVYIEDELGGQLGGPP